MIAGFLITRISLVCLLSELKYSSAFPTANSGYPNAWKDGEKQEMHGYATRRPLDYVRALRQSNRNPQVKNWAQKPQESLRAPSHTQIKETLSPHQPRAMSPSQPPNYSSVKPKSLQIHLDVPLLDLLGQNEQTGSSTKTPGYGNYGTDSQPYRQSSFQIHSDVNSPIPNIPGNKYHAKYDYEQKNDHSVSKQSFSVPFPATSVKTSENHGHFLNIKPGSTFAQNSYMEPVKMQSGSTQMGSKWQPWPHTGNAYEQEPQQIGSKWSIFSHAGSGDQTQHKPIYTKPSHDKLSVSSLYSSQHRNPQSINQDTTPTGQSWDFQKPGMEKFPSLPVSKYSQHPVVYFPHTSSPREDYGKDQSVHPDPTKFQLSWPQQQYNGVPSRGSGLYSEGKKIAPPISGPSKVHIQSGFLVPDSDLSSKGSTKNPNEGKPDQESSQPSIQLTLTVPFPAKSVDIVKNSSGHLVNIKPQSTDSVGDYMVPTKQQSSSTQTGLKWPSNHHTGHKQTQWQTYEPLQTYVKPVNGQLTSSWQSSQDKTPSGSSWEFQKPSMTNYPSLPISKYPGHPYVYSAHTSLPRKDYKEPAVQPVPFQMVPSQFYSPQVKPYGNGYIQKLISHSVGSPFPFVSESYDYSQSKPSDHSQNVERTHHSRPFNTFDFPSSGFSHLEVTSTSHDPRKEQKHVPSPYQNSHRTGASHNTDASYPLPNSHTLSTAYRSQKTFPRQDADGHKQDEKENFAGLRINLEGGGDSIAGKTYFAAETPYKHGYPGKWLEQDIARTPIHSNTPHVNVQAQVSVKNSLKDLESPFSNKKPQSYLQSEHNPRYHFPEQVSYLVAQTNVASIPKNSEQHFSGSLQPFQDPLSFQW